MKTMTDRAAQTTQINAPIEKCVQIVLDFESYPDWAKDVKEAVVRERNAEGQATLVEYRASALGRSTHYTLQYDLSELPARLSWHLQEGDIMRALNGAYSFVEIDGATQVFYELELDLVVPLPGFVKRRAEARILIEAVKELKARAES
jgi:uncharacterized membrane protein